MTKTITVLGTAHLTRTKDIHVLDLEPMILGRTCREAIEKGAKYETLLASLFPKEKITRAYYYMDELRKTVHHEDKPDEHVFVGYCVKAKYYVRFDSMEEFAAAMDTVASSLPNTKVTFREECSDKAVNEDELTALAVEDAKKKATLIAEGLGVKLGSPILVEYHASTPSMVESTRLYEAGLLGESHYQDFHSRDEECGDAVKVTFELA